MPMNTGAMRNRMDGRRVTAILGPTNTGKTHLAIERMLGHRTGLIGLPLRLLAREVYDQVVKRVGADQVSLVTGEERIEPEGSRFQVCTVEAMPASSDADFVAIDEVQLAANLERGHFFTDRLLHLRGRYETMLLGAETVRGTLEQLLPGLAVTSRPRMSKLTYAGAKKITRLPPRSAVVAFSADEVYAIAELIRRQRGGSAVVLGALSPRTRNAQVQLYQSGEVDFLVATDAIGMGLNLAVDHVAFAQERKFDGHQYRRLTPAEMAQIAGRAGRHMRDGTFGVTGRVAAFEEELVEALEAHRFEPVKALMWRSRDLDFSSIESLRSSLDCASGDRLLTKTPPATDQIALDGLSERPAIARACTDARAVELLWDVCQTPDYRKISPGAHGDLLGSVFLDVHEHGRINQDWLAKQIRMTDRTDGDIDALSNRLAHIRTWTYLSHRKEWLDDAPHWRDATRAIEDRLSDALHQALTKRFIDRRTSILTKRLRENAMLEAQIGDGGAVIVEGHLVGHLRGFRFNADASATGHEAKAANAAAAKALTAEFDKRSTRFAAAPNGDIALGEDAIVRWLGEPVAQLAASEESALKPGLIVLADSQLAGAALEKVRSRLERWLGHHIEQVLRPLVEMSRDQTLEGMARGLAFQLVENLGIIARPQVAGELKELGQDARATLRRHGVRFGAYHVFVPQLLKPAPIRLIALLWALANDKLTAPELVEVPAISASGRTSVEIDGSHAREFYRLAGYRILGKKAVRIDMLERLADLIRPATSWNEGDDGPTPEGAVGGHCFVVTPAMMSILGATHEDMQVILNELGYRGQPRPAQEVLPALPDEPAKGPESDEAEPGGLSEAGPSEADPAGAAPADPAPCPTAEGAPKNSDQTCPDGDDDAETPQTVIVWRRAARTRGRARQSQEPGRRRPAKRGPKRGASAKKATQSRSTRPAKADSGPDPDSPFAKLAELKDSLTKSDG